MWKAFWLIVIDHIVFLIYTATNSTDKQFSDSVERRQRCRLFDERSSTSLARANISLLMPFRLLTRNLNGSRITQRKWPTLSTSASVSPDRLSFTKDRRSESTPSLRGCSSSRMIFRKGSESASANWFRMSRRTYCPEKKRSEYRSELIR